MPVLRAKGEAEALCPQLNNEGEVAACITSDSDAFLFGVKTVIKVLRSNCKEPFECYNIADIESGIGLKRKQMVAMALLIGSDHDLHGDPGFGVETTLRFVQLFDEDQVLDKLHEIGKGIYPFLEGVEKTHVMICLHHPQRAHQVRARLTAHTVVTLAARKIIARLAAIIAWWIHWKIAWKTQLVSSVNVQVVKKVVFHCLCGMSLTLRLWLTC